MGTFTISEDLRKAFTTKNIEYVAIKEATPEQFFEAIAKAKENNPHGAFVTQHSLEDYRQMPHLFTTLDGSAGIAITKENNIVSLFNGGEKRGVLKTLLPVAIENGGRKLDNFNSEKLSAMYELYGFFPVSKVMFDQQYAPEDWNYERDGTPDVVFWIHNGDSASDVVINLGSYIVLWDFVKDCSTYEEAELFRDWLIELIDKIESDVD